MGKLKKSVPNVLVLLLAIVIGGLALTVMQDLLYYSDREKQFYYLITIVGLVLVLILVRQLISMRHSIGEEKDKKIINSEFDLMINLLFRNQRSTMESRNGFYKDARHFIREINRFIPAETYQKYLTSLLDASHELAVIESNQQVKSSHKRKSYRKKTTQTSVVPLEQLARQNYLVELGIIELTSRKLISDRDGQHEFQLTIKELKKQYQSNYQELSILFDSLSIILTFLNKKAANNELSADSHQQYISIVRNILTREDLLLVLVYALVIPEGCSLGIELVGSSLFGNEYELLQKKYVDYPELFASQLIGFTTQKNLKKSLKEQELLRYYYEARLKEERDKTLTKRELIDKVIKESRSRFGVTAEFNYLELLAASYSKN